MARCQNRHRDNREGAYRNRHGADADTDLVHHPRRGLGFGDGASIPVNVVTPSGDSLPPSTIASAFENRPRETESHEGPLSHFGGFGTEISGVRGGSATTFGT